MTTYIKGEDGKFAGSIGEGKTDVPTAAPEAPVARRSLKQVEADLASTETLYRKYQARQFDLALEAVSIAIKEEFPTATHLVVADFGNEPGPMLQPWSVLDNDNELLWNRDDGELELLYTLEEWCPVLDRGLNSPALEPWGRTDWLWRVRLI